MTLHDEVSLYIEAPPEVIYDLVCDMPRMGTWSPECYRCEWLDIQGAIVGSRFRAYNKRGMLRWSNTPVVITAEPGREFAFDRPSPGKGSVIWRYRIQPEGSGARLIESYTIIRPTAKPIATLFLAVLQLTAGVRDRSTDLRSGMKQTLEQIRAAAEST